MTKLVLAALAVLFSTLAQTPGAMAQADTLKVAVSQRFPDTIHHPHFPGALLRPGETYGQVTQRVFSQGD